LTGQAIRPSQFVMTYGVGSIIETSEGPVIIPDFEKWGRVFGQGRTPSVYNFEIRGSSSASALLDNGIVFRIPTNLDLEEIESHSVFWTLSFPGWALCVSHGKLYESRGGISGCRECRDQGRTTTDIKRQAIRFVRACKDGHLDDIDWYGMVHRGTGAACGSRVFRWTARGSSLRNFIISCDECGSSASLKDVYDRTFTCSGRFPEKGVSHPGCAKRAYVVLRGSSNLRLAEIVTVIAIPKNDSPLHILLDNFQMRTALSTRPAWTKEELLEVLDSMEIEDPSGTDPRVKQQILKETPERILQVIKDIKRLNSKAATTEEEVRKEELRALKEAAEFGKPPDPKSTDPDFQVKLENVYNNVPFYKYRLRVTPIERLSVIIVQKGYRRLDTDNTLVPTFYFHENRKWFPGVKLKGEGIFIDSGRTELKIQSDQWLKTYEQTGESHQHPVAVWWHTLAHRIISALSVDSGYSSAAIREMVYVDVNKENGSTDAGILLYTTQQGGDGSLGGLIALVPQFENVLKSATRNIRACSNDPLCSEERIRPGKYNGAACYACLLLSETSCSHRNMHLDRNILIENL
jgi:hypothetical protein